MSNTNQKPTNLLKNSAIDILSFARFLLLGYDVMRKEKHTKATFAFAMLYFCELMSYLTFVLCIPDEPNKIHYPIALFSGTMLGGVVGSLLIGVRNSKIKNLLRYSTWIYLVGTFLHLFINIYQKFGFDSLEHDAAYFFFIELCAYVRLAAYFIFGLGFASSIGLIVSQIVEKLPRYNRSFTIAVVHSFAFLSPVVIAIIFMYMNRDNIDKDVIDNAKIIALTFAAFFALVSTYMVRDIPEDALFRSKESSSFGTWLGWIGLNPFLSKKNSEKDARYFWLASLSGFNMLFFFYLFSNIDKIAVIEKNSMQNYDVILFSYLGLSIGSLFWSWRAKVLGSRRKNIVYSNLFQFLLLFWFGYNLLSEHNFGAIAFKYFIFFLGFNCSWALILGQAAEQFMTKNRASLMALLPNLFRFAPLFLGLATKSESNNFSTELLKQTNITILLAAFLFLLISTIATLSLDDLFGSESNIFDRKNKSIASSELRASINKLGKDRYLHNVNGLLSNHLSENLKSLYYLSTFYYINKNKENQWKTTEFTAEEVLDEKGNIIKAKLKNDLINEDTLKHRNKPEFQDKDKISWVHTFGDKFIVEEKLKFISGWIAEGGKKGEEEDDKCNGLLIWKSGLTHTKLRYHEDPNRNRKEGDIFMIVLNLSDITFKNDKIDIFPEGFLGSNWNENEATMKEKWFEKIEELRKSVDFQGSMIPFLEMFDESEYEQVKNSLIHFYMDSLMYPRGSYYRYWIRPYKTVKETLAVLMLKLSTGISKSRLGQLRDLMTMIVMTKAIIKLDEQNKQIVDSNSMVSAEHEHHKKYQLKSLQKSIEKMLSKFNVKKNDTDYKFITYQLNHLYKTADLFTKLMHEEQKDGVQQLNNMEVSILPLQETMLEELDIIKNIMDNIEMEKPETGDLLLKDWDNIKNTINIDENIAIEMNKTIFFIVVHELLKNAVSHVNDNNPKLKITFIPSQISDSYLLCFINNHNRTMTQGSFDYINQDTFSKLEGIGAKRGGIRTLKRLLNAYENGAFKISVLQRSLTTDETIICLEIPNKFVVKI